jgi:hypothetical protein
MPGEPLPKTTRQRRIHPQSVILWLLFLGLVVSFGANIREDHEISDLTMDVQVLRQESERQIAALREAQSSTSGQDLTRLQQLTTELQRADEQDRRQVAATAPRKRLDLPKSVEEKHQETVTTISDSGVDARSTATPKPSPVGDLQKPHSEVSQPPSQAFVPASQRTIEHPAPVSAATVEDKTYEPPPAPAPKKRFWSKLNPFARNKNKHQHNESDGVAESSSTSASTGTPAQ